MKSLVSKIVAPAVLAGAAILGCKSMPAYQTLQERKQHAVKTADGIASIDSTNATTYEKSMTFNKLQSAAEAYFELRDVGLKGNDKDEIADKMIQCVRFIKDTLEESEGQFFYHFNCVVPTKEGEGRPEYCGVTVGTEAKSLEELAATLDVLLPEVSDLDGDPDAPPPPPNIPPVQARLEAKAYRTIELVRNSRRAYSAVPEGAKEADATKLGWTGLGRAEDVAIGLLNNGTELKFAGENGELGSSFGIADYKSLADGEVGVRLAPGSDSAKGQLVVLYTPRKEE